MERRVYEEVDLEEAWSQTGKAPIGVRWVDVRKSEGIYRSRLVAKDYKPRSKKGDIEGLYASMPLLELVKLVIVRALKKGDKVMLIDIKKAHLHAPIDGDVYVDLPPERAVPGRCAKLLFTLYGMRVAAKNWEKEYSGTLIANGFAVGKANKSSFYHAERDIRAVVHGDDFVVSGKEEQLRWSEEMLKRKYPLKMRGLLGPDPEDDKEAVILNRKVYCVDGEIEFEADSEHVPRMLRAAGMEGCNTTVVPGSREDPVVDEEPLDGDKSRVYRSVVARANYLAQDRPDLRYTVKELCKKMSSPTSADWARMKKMCRYLAGRPRMRQKNVGIDGGVIEVFVDADWGSCKKSRVSTSGGAIMAFGMCLKVWSTTQGAIARSSGEAEPYAATKGMSEGLGLQSMCADMGIHLGVRVRTDSDACRGTCHRTGLGRLKHMEVESLWAQEAVERKRLELTRVNREDNPADCLTKYVTYADMQRQLAMLGFTE